VGLLPDGADTRAWISLALLVAGTVLAVLALRNRRYEVPATALATAGVVGWLLTADAYDGPVLAVVVDGNGIDLGDLLSLPAVLLVLWLSYRGWRR
jgi:Na+-translocating ferredoxin:NAD+ oxidoreductase RnfD subunit